MNINKILGIKASKTAYIATTEIIIVSVVRIEDMINSIDISYQIRRANILLFVLFRFDYIQNTSKSVYYYENSLLNEGIAC